ncbi:hypothetical protein [Deinococcus radiophilus]|uniref:hypothetical protein n=1 Tax=Deinococcus radiophilus TaxID=32062 RepID=UPI00360AFA04
MPRKKPEEDPRERHVINMNAATLCIQDNLEQVRWAWEYPRKAYHRTSMSMQLAMTLLTLIATVPLEEVVYDLAPDPLSTRRRAALDIPDLRLDNPEGFLRQLGQWRSAIAEGRVEIYTDPKLRHPQPAGVRAWLPPRGAERSENPRPAWEMTLDMERLSCIVHGLLGAMPAWGPRSQ